jgi:hypothetical protein
MWKTFINKEYLKNRSMIQGHQFKTYVEKSGETFKIFLSYFQNTM